MLAPFSGAPARSRAAPCWRARFWSPGFRPAAGVLVVFLVVAGVHAAGSESHESSGAAAEGGVFFPAAGVTFAALVLLPRRLSLLVVAAAFCGELGISVRLGEAGVLAVAVRRNAATMARSRAITRTLSAAFGGHTPGCPYVVPLRPRPAGVPPVPATSESRITV
jgi:hypothetical protein